jgi:pimeloyl-ACP methyl ester carboxylesterase
MNKVISRDGTPIAYDRLGSGPPLILVDGALCHRKFGPMPKLAPLLAKEFTVFMYDRRGRGGSGDTAPYAVEREVEDIDALIKEAGGSAFLYGVSSGAALALEAANRGLAIRKVALYEAPFIIDDSRPPLPDDYVARLTGLIAANRRGEAVRHFMKAVGVPRIFIALMRFTPAWSKLKAVAHTLIYDTQIVHENQRGRPLPRTRWDSVAVPTLVAVGGKSPAWMQHAMESLARVVPRAERTTLAGQTHMVTAEAQAPMLVEFFKGCKLA